MAESPPLVLRYSAPRLRYPKGEKFGRGGQYAPRYLIELGDSKEKWREQNRELARRVQDDVVEALKEGTKRPNVSTGRLAAATASPENIFASAQVWGIGVPSFLDRSQAKYWRTIDEGSEKLWARPFKGMSFYVRRSAAFGQTLAGFTDDDSFAGPAYVKAQVGAGSDLFHPLNRATAEDIIATNGKMPRWMGKLFITKEIEAQDYYHRGFEMSGGIIQALRVYKSALDQLKH